ncbi:uncharacterized protein LAESUDRAFT_659459 [Laetiporus sulphureus 93-53]|uniref:Uncharacterized protein n=1 Tax=Laetiporus sulphureus 93-53 TaxID=1314785 RepID=A0A165CWF8_9APHY|nr:uncharacterized protein LAESUDRAFT_659459 [Laetiporus sulphureus 93-53]KZT03579.1 hypothetical protein LAESUDRAFT_659459 [Laetiporus sulphureus 93-53]
MRLDLQKLKRWLVHTSNSLIHFAAQFIERRPLARLLSTFLCCLAIVIRPVAHLGGAYAFLVLPFLALIFSVQESLAQQLELTVLNIIGALCGIGFSTLGKYIASLTPDDSARSRAACAIFLVAISFFAGLIKSRLVRLTLSMRISLFVSIWLLTINIGDSSRVLLDSGYFLYATLAPASLALVALLIVMSVLRWSASSFEREMARTFALLARCVSISLNGLGEKQKDIAADPAEYLSLRNQLFKQSIMLNETYSQAAFELRLGRLSLKAVRPLIGIVEHIRRELAWGMSTLQPQSPGFSRASSRRPSASRRSSAHRIRHRATLPSHDKFISAIRAPALSLGHAIISAMHSVELLIVVAYDQDQSSFPPGDPARAASLKACSVKYSIRVAEQALVKARNEARERLGNIFNEMDLEGRALAKNVDYYPKEVLDGSLTMIALLQMAHEMRTALQIAERMYNEYEESHVRLWYPHISLSWLGVPPRALISDDRDATLQIRASVDHTPWTEDADVNLTTTETHEALAEMGYTIGEKRLPSGLSYSTLTKENVDGKRKRKRSCWLSLSAPFADLWALPWMLRFRIMTARVNRAVLHSNHLHHAIKNAIGVAILCFPAFMPPDSRGFKWFSSWHGQWMAISYVWVLETNTGATWRMGYLRLVGTTLAAIYAYITWLICHVNPYGLTVMVTAADIPFTWMVTKTTLTPLAVPAAVTLPIIAFAQYVDPDPSESVLKLAAIRALMIAVGIVGALLMNSLVFPRHCRVVFLSDTSRTLSLLSQLYMTLGHDIFRKQPAFEHPERHKMLKLELEIRNSLYRLSVLITTMHDEISLLPKPLAHYRQTVTVMQKFLDVMTGLRKIRENIPRRETVARVFNERREFMSCVCITLYACQHAFRAREPLPQFIPSPKHALENLEHHVQDSIRQAREEDAYAMGLSLVYAFAEQEVLKNMVVILEELLENTGRLFGTSAWLTHEQHLSMMSLPEEDGDNGWYSTFRWEEV